MQSVYFSERILNTRWQIDPTSLWLVFSPLLIPVTISVLANFVCLIGLTIFDACVPDSMCLCRSQIFLLAMRLACIVASTRSLTRKAITIAKNLKERSYRLSCTSSFLDAPILYG
uniref:Transcription initiation factor IIE subunit beta n=1 Tax=Schistocephalus solidus TaxID=70667 RepID=A0A0X3PNS5_SCHSO